MKKNKNLILSSFFMFAISLVCLITASYAWFSMTGSVEVTSPEFTASAPDNLQIAWKNERDIWTEWATKVNVKLSQNDRFKLMPASSYTGFDGQIFYTDTINNGTSDENTLFEIASVGTSSSGEGYYLDVPLRIRTTGAEDIGVALDIESTDESSRTYVTDIDENGNKIASRDIAQCVRIAFVNADKNNNSMNNYSVDTHNPFVYNASSSFKGDVIKELDANKHSVKIASNYLKNNSTQILHIVGGRGNSDDNTGTEFIARIWIEGEDPNCVFANGGKSFAISLKFIAIDENTSNN